MDAALTAPLTASAQDREIAATVARERGRLLAFIRRSMADAAEAEDVLQEALVELVIAYRMLEPLEQVGAWLRRVARNRIIDRFRRRRAAPAAAAEADGAEWPADADDGPEAMAMRALLLEELEEALAELPPEQRSTFLAHELEGVSFEELAARSGVSINTLLSRKHYAVRQLRRRLRDIWDDWLLG